MKMKVKRELLKLDVKLLYRILSKIINSVLICGQYFCII